MTKSISHRNHKVLLELLREARTEAGLTQVEVAKRLHRPQSFVSDYETGVRRLDLIQLQEVCKILGVSLTQFVKRFENSSN
ncbi:MAG: helix-turn-helix transcriptional regulator [Gammaproteobacteria bacterium]|nr:helix-turn-helix transcriptional regulator [Gammaproteobacteria bacterium]